MATCSFHKINYPKANGYRLWTWQADNVLLNDISKAIALLMTKYFKSNSFSDDTNACDLTIIYITGYVGNKIIRTYELYNNMIFLLKSERKRWPNASSKFRSLSCDFSKINVNSFCFLNQNHLQATSAWLVCSCKLVVFMG